MIKTFGLRLRDPMAAAVALLSVAAEPGTAVAQGYTAAQATQGREAYAQNCASCHGAGMDDGRFGPALKGSTFQGKWGGAPLDKLFGYITQKMPPGAAGSLGDAKYLAIVASILQANAVPPGAVALTAQPASLAAKLPGGVGSEASRKHPGGDLAPGVTLPPWPDAPNPLDHITPITDALTAAPPDGDWLTWRRTLDDQGFSPLKQIRTDNVATLRLAWSWSIPSGANETAPLVHDGVLFVYAFGDHVEALNAATGDLLWDYSRHLPDGARPIHKRNIAIWGDKVYVATSDVHMVALDIKTGTPVWDQEIADFHKGFRLTGGPLVVKNRVMVGTAGQVPGANFIVGLDAGTGKEIWRFNTVALPGVPGGNSWNDVPAEARNGGSVWTPGSYDPATGLAYFGTGQTYDTAPLLHRTTKPGTTNDGLYLDTTLAFDPETGKLAWHFQHFPDDQWDLDWAFERTVLTLPTVNDGKKLVLTAGKLGIFDALDAKTGKYAFSMDLGYQTLVTAIDPQTGAKTIDPKAYPAGQNIMICPHPGAGKSWTPSSYDASTRTLFLPLTEACMDLPPVKPGEHGFLTSGVGVDIRPRPDSDGKYGRLEALDLATRKPLWTVRQRVPQTTGVLATAGGVLFAGALDRRFSAYDSATGKQLWQARLNDVPASVPISFSVAGRQYIAITVGNGGPLTATFPPLIPEIQNPPAGGGAVWVFELPDAAAP